MRRGGFTLLEVVISSTIASIVIVAVLVFYSRIVIVSRQQFEQVRITEDARVQLNRVSDTLRNARQLDCDGNGDTSLEGEYWLQMADPYQIVVYSNVDEDAAIEKVRYFIDLSESGEKILLKRGIIQPGSATCDFSGAEQVSTVLGSLRNISSDTALFDYYSSDSVDSLMSLPIVLTSVKRVHLHLVIDATENVLPNAAYIETDVVPRGEVCSGDGCLTGAACTIPSGVLAQHSYNDPFADDAFSNCKDYCATTTLPAGECCGWAVGINYDSSLGTVSSYCQCGNSGVSLGTVIASPLPNNYTDFYRNCFAGTFCESGVKGNPVCNPGCLESGIAGSCSCACN